MFLGVDTGGTFTDFVCFDSAGMRFHKVLSTPDDPSRAIEQGIMELGLDASALHIVHGSTVATNAILQRKGVHTLFVTHQGLEDLLTIGRQTRPALYQLCPDAITPVVGREDCIGISGRISASGEEQSVLDAGDLKRVIERVATGGYEAVAVCLLFSFLNPAHERAIAKALHDTYSDDLFVSLSHQVLAEYREYERSATTFLNAYVGPLVQRYLKRLELSLGAKHLYVMHSAGGVMQAELAGKQAVRLVLSGPAGGLVAAQEIGAQLSEKHILTFDMGGTSTDVALIQGRASKTTEGEIAGMPVSLPMLDIHTIGAGGGSIAWLDEAGLPQVGPESAGARPGPVCYGLGGEKPTVTDANLLLGRMPANACLAGSMSLDMEAARCAFSQYGETLGLSAETAARAVIDIAEEHMAGALRVVSVQRGYDPADFSLLCFGGAGGLHACALAEKLSMSKVIIPVASGAFSALGMLLGKQQSEFSRSRRFALQDTDTAAEMQQLFMQMQEEAVAQMQGLALTFERHVDMRYIGQGFHLTMACPDDDLEQLKQRFEDAHMQAYGHQLNRDVEIMTVRLSAFVERPLPVLPELCASTEAAYPVAHSEIYGVGRVPHFMRVDLNPGLSYEGPMLVLEDIATLWLARGWQMQVSTHGHLLLEKIDADQPALEAVDV
ncbi:MAG: hydantoinase/oxoprolinase family protein [Mariprofundus sp.]|nr:hydantoinase/oxoprolinase family protein [Mariprofundus sp.]